jgi:hypothetical protein
MKLPAMVALGLLLFPPGAAREPKPKGLEPYVGKALRKFDERATAEFQKEVEALTGDKPQKKEWWSYKPWWVKPFATGNAAWLFLEAYPGYDVPDVSSVQVHVFDKNWKRLAKQSFPTGYRFSLEEVALARDNPLKQILLVAKVESTGPFIVRRGEKKRPAFEQGDYQFQYYALLGDRFVMVRLEDDKKKLARNHYRWQTPLKGPAVPKRTREEWVRSLNSKNPVEQLAIMVWLSGEHLSSKETRRQDANQESVEDSRLLEAVRDAVGTKKALRELTSSRNSWVQEYARLTLRVVHE